MASYSIEKDLGFLLSDITHLMRHAFDKQASELGLTRAQWRLVAHLLRHDGVTPSELARTLDMGRASVGETLLRLEAKGVVVRRTDGCDRRVWRVHLAKKGRFLAPKLAETARRIYAHALDGLSASDIQQLLSMLGVLRKNSRSGI